MSGRHAGASGHARQRPVRHDDDVIGKYRQLEREEADAPFDGIRICGEEHAGRESQRLVYRFQPAVRLRVVSPGMVVEEPIPRCKLLGRAALVNRQSHVETRKHERPVGRKSTQPGEAADAWEQTRSPISMPECRLNA